MIATTLDAYAVTLNPEAGRFAVTPKQGPNVREVLGWIVAVFFDGPRARPVEVCLSYKAAAPAVQASAWRELVRILAEATLEAEGATS
ncbi:MAG TPA: hypothetical protein VGK67_14005 [Myxococcales bacterium]|jgi:hypothetical protein